MGLESKKSIIQLKVLGTANENSEFTMSISDKEPSPLPSPVAGQIDKGWHRTGENSYTKAYGRPFGRNAGGKLTIQVGEEDEFRFPSSPKARMFYTNEDLILNLICQAEALEDVLERL
eukprot:TRINITY_DN4693_c0_g1_i3.p1 TRINITY_DN4693_c0_g1~~TRINITY_DN4693_c0_g1_i3.p1  ORF type:complete len:118 (+),score=18.07 TRINITY_DN4693_c0_g1_i3:98-451(+)